jgi:hypothetical protein
MKTKKMQNVTWWIMGVLILGLSVALVSCDSDSDSSVTSSQVSVTDLISFSAQNEDGVASGKLYGAYYSAGDGSFRISILQAGDYRVSYTTSLGTFYLVVRVNNSAVMALGLTKLEDGLYDELSSVCIASGTAELPDDVQESGPVTYYPEGGVATSPSVFTSDGSSAVCLIQSGAVVESNTVALLPALEGSSSGSGGGTTTVSGTLVIAASATNAALTVTGCGGTISGSGTSSVTVTNPSGTCSITLDKSSGGGTENVIIATTLNGSPVDSKTCNNVTTNTTSMAMGAVNADGTGASGLACPCEHDIYINASGGTGVDLYYWNASAWDSGTALPVNATYQASGAAPNGQHGFQFFNGSGSPSATVSVGDPNHACQTQTYSCTIGQYFGKVTFAGGVAGTLNPNCETTAP